MLKVENSFLCKYVLGPCTFLIESNFEKNNYWKETFVKIRTVNNCNESLSISGIQTERVEVYRHLGTRITYKSEEIRARIELIRINILDIIIFHQAPLGQ